MKEITILGSKDGVDRLIEMLDLPHVQVLAEILTIKSPELSHTAWPTASEMIQHHRRWRDLLLQRS